MDGVQGKRKWWRGEVSNPTIGAIGPRRSWGTRMWLESGVAEEGFEAVVHVGLDVAVEEGEAGLVGGELDGGAAI